CGSVTESDCTTIEAAIINLAGENKFHLRHTVVENHGLCHECYEVNACQDHDHCEHNHEQQAIIKKK
ncbi:hypothetical protein, partial [Bacillus thuringiensis]